MFPSLLRCARRALCVWLCGSLVAPHAVAWASFSGDTDWPTLKSAPHQTPPPATERERLIAVLVADDLVDDPTLLPLLERYLDDITTTAGASVVPVAVPPSTSPLTIRDGLASLYFQGHDGRAQSQLEGFVLIGDLPLPTVDKFGAQHVSISPYTDIVDPSYVWQAAQSQFVAVPHGDDRPELWHGVIRSDQSGPDAIDDLVRYFETNHLVHSGELTFPERAFFLNQPEQAQGVSPAELQLYRNYLTHLKPLSHQWYTTALLRQVMGEVLSEVDIPWDAIPEEYRPEEKPDDLSSVFDFMPDIWSKGAIEQYLRTYMAMHTGWVSDITTMVQRAGRWAPSQIDTTPTLVAQKDETSRQYLLDFQLAAEQIIFDAIQESQIAARFDFRELTADNCGGRDLYWYGVDRDDITTADQCSIIRGTAPDPTASGSHAQMVEANIAYDPSTIDECYTYIDQSEDNPIKRWRKDPLEGCCASNLEYDEDTGEPHYREAKRCMARHDAADIVSNSRWQCVTGIVKHHVGPEQPIFDIGATTRRLAGSVGASGCASIMKPPQCDGQVDSLYHHIEPTPETLRAQLLAQDAQALPIDDPRGVSFYGLSGTFFRLEYPSIYDLLQTVDSTADPLTEFERLRHAVFSLFTPLGTTLTQNVLPQSGGTCSGSQLAEFLPTDFTESTPGFSDTLAAVPTLLHDLQTTYPASRLAEALFWLQLDVESKNRLAFAHALGAYPAAQWPVPTTLTPAQHSQRFFHLDPPPTTDTDPEAPAPATGYEFMHLVAAPGTPGSSAIQWGFEQGQPSPTPTDTTLSVGPRPPAAPTPQYLIGDLDLRTDILAGAALTETCSGLSGPEAVTCYADFSTKQSQATAQLITDPVSGQVTTITATESQTPTDLLTATPEALTRSSRSAQPSTFALQWFADGAPASTLGSGSVTLSITDPAAARAFTLTPRTLTPRQGQAQFQLLPQGAPYSGTFLIEALYSGPSAHSLTIPVTVTPQQWVLDRPTAQVTAGADTPITFSLSLTDPDGQPLADTPSTTLEVTSDGHSFPNGQTVTLTDGQLTLPILPDTRSGSWPITLTDPSGSLPPFTTQLSVTPGPLASVTASQPHPFLVTGGPTHVVDLRLTDTYGNALVTAPLDHQWQLPDTLPEGLTATFHPSPTAAQAQLHLSLRPGATVDSLTLTTPSLPTPTTVEFQTITNPSLRLDTTVSQLAVTDDTVQVGLIRLTTPDGQLIPLSTTVDLLSSSPQHGSFPSTVTLTGGISRFAYARGHVSGQTAVTPQLGGFTADPFNFTTLAGDAVGLSAQFARPTVAAAAGESLTLTVSALDSTGSSTPWSGTVPLSFSGPASRLLGDTLPSTITLTQGEATLTLPVTTTSASGTITATVGAGTTLVPASAQTIVTTQLTPSDLSTLSLSALHTTISGIDGLGLTSSQSFGLRWLLSGAAQSVSTLVQAPDPSLQLGALAPDGHLSARLTAQFLTGRPTAQFSLLPASDFADTVPGLSPSTPLATAQLTFDRPATLGLAGQSTFANIILQPTPTPDTAPPDFSFDDNVFLLDDTPIIEVSPTGGLTLRDLALTLTQPKDEPHSLLRWALTRGDQTLGTLWLIPQAQLPLLTDDGTVLVGPLPSFDPTTTDGFPRFTLGDTVGQIGFSQFPQLYFHTTQTAGEGLYFTPEPSLLQQREVSAQGNVLSIRGARVLEVGAYGQLLLNAVPPRDGQFPDGGWRFAPHASRNVRTYDVFYGRERLGRLHFQPPRNGLTLTPDLDQSDATGLLLQSTADRPTPLTTDQRDLTTYEFTTPRPTALQQSLRLVPEFSLGYGTGIQLQPLAPWAVPTPVVTGPDSDSAQGWGFRHLEVHEPARSQLGSPRQSIEDDNGHNVVWEGDWRPAVHLAGGSSVGEATTIGASDALIVLGDPTLRLPRGQSAPVSSGGVTPDIGRHIWRSPSGSLSQVLVTDLNADNQPDLIPRVGRQMHLLYADPKGNTNYRDQGLLLQWPAEPTGQVLSLDLGGDGLGDFLALVEGQLLLERNINGQLIRQPLDLPVPPDVTRFKGGDFDNDGDLDLAFLTSQPALYISTQGRAGEWSPPDLIETFTQADSAPPISESYARPLTTPPPTIRRQSGVVFYDNDGDGDQDYVKLKDNGEIKKYKKKKKKYKKQSTTLSKYGDVAQIKGRDLTGDGRLDIIMQTIDNQLYLAKGTKDGFQNRLPILPETEWYAPAIRDFPTNVEDPSQIDRLYLDQLFPQLRYLSVTSPDLSQQTTLAVRDSRFVEVPDPTDPDRQLTFIPVPLTQWQSAELTLQGTAGLITLSNDTPVTDLQLIIPQFGQRRVDPTAVSFSGCGADAVATVQPQWGSAWASGLTLTPDQTCQISFTLLTPSSSDLPTPVLSVQSHPDGGDMVVIPWQTDIADPTSTTLYQFYASTEAYRPVTAPVPFDKETIEPYASMTDEEEAEYLAAALAEDSDGDTIPDFFDSAPRSNPETATDSLGATFASTQRASQTCVGECSWSLALPSYSFLAPGNRSFYLPPITIPSAPSPGVPVFWVPPPPFAPTHLASLFRLYISPTTSLQLGMGLCGANFNGFSAPLFAPFCVAFAIPLVPSLPQSCPDPLAGADTPPDSGVSTQPLAASATGPQQCSLGLLANDTLGHADPWATQHSTLQAQPPKNVRGTTTLPRNTAVGSFDFITTWVKDQMAEFSNFNLPELKVIQPSLPEASSSNSSSSTSEPLSLDSLSQSPFIDLTLKPTPINYPQIDPSVLQSQLRDIRQHVKALKTFSQQFKSSRDIFQSQSSQGLTQLRDQLAAQQLLSDFLAAQPRFAGPLPNFTVASPQQLAQVQLSDARTAILDAVTARRDRILSDSDTFLAQLDTLPTQFQDTATQLQSLDQAARSLPQLVERIREIKQTLSQNDQQISDFFGKYLKSLKDDLQSWLTLRSDVMQIMSTVGKIPAVFNAFGANCHGCAVGKGKLDEFIIRILFGWIKLPVIPMPQLPNLVLDLSQVTAGAEVTIPEIKLNPVTITPQLEPTLPKNVPLPTLKVSELSRLLSYTDPLRLTVAQSAHPLLPTAQAQTPSLPSSFDLDTVLPAVSFPTVPSAPQLPAISVPDFSTLDLPTVDLPSLPTIPPVPFDIPNFLEPLEKIIDVLETLLQLVCFILKGIMPVPEWDLNSHIESITNRTSMIPLDWSPTAWKFDVPKVPKKDLVTTLKYDLAPSLEALNQTVTQVQSTMDCSVTTLSNLSTLSGAPDCLPVDTPRLSHTPASPTTQTISLTAWGDVPPSAEVLAATTDFASRLDRIRQGDINFGQSQLLLSQLAQFTTPQHWGEEMHQLAAHPPEISQLVASTMPPEILEAAQAFGAERLTDVSSTPSELSDRAMARLGIDLDTGSVTLPTPESQVFLPAGTTQCDPCTGLAQPLTSFPTAVGQSLGATPANPDYDQSLHDCAAPPSQPCPYADTPTFHFIGSDLYLKSCPDQWGPRLGGGQRYGDLLAGRAGAPPSAEPLSPNAVASDSPEFWSFARFASQFAPAQVFDFTTTSRGAQLRLDRLDPQTAYYEWTISDRPDMSYEWAATPSTSQTPSPEQPSRPFLAPLYDFFTGDTPTDTPTSGTVRSSDRWDRTAFLVRRPPRLYEIRPLTSRLVSLTGTPEIIAPPEHPLLTQSPSACADPNLPKPFLSGTHTLLGLAPRSEVTVRVPQRPDQPFDTLTIVIEQGEETIIEDAELCVTQGEVSHIALDAPEQFESIPPRPNLALPHGTAFALGAGDQVVIELFDGTQVQIDQHQTYVLYHFDQLTDIIRHLALLPPAKWYGALSAQRGPVSSFPRFQFLHDPYPTPTDQPLTAQFAHPTARQLPPDTPFVIDARPSVATAGLADAWFDLDPTVDTDADGNFTNDRDFASTTEPSLDRFGQPRPTPLPDSLALAPTTTDTPDRAFSFRQLFRALTAQLTAPLSPESPEKPANSDTPSFDPAHPAFTRPPDSESLGNPTTTFDSTLYFQHPGLPTGTSTQFTLHLRDTLDQHTQQTVTLTVTDPSQ